MGVMKYCYINNISVPKDLGVAGYDNIEQSSMLPIPLTTVDQNDYLLGKTAAGILINQIKNKEANIKEVILKPKLIIRKSCGEN
ncbi:LacI family transcriptional regulator [Clostridium sp. USBA 49]|nr:LacI family transcriptional regulator [Clostridium sp. USBA 49]